MPSDEEPALSQVDQDVTATRDAYAAAGNQYFYGRDAAPPERGQPHPDDDPWTALAREHVAWQRAKDGPGLGELKAATLTIIARLHRQYSDALEACGDDPWLDEDQPIRMAQHVDSMVRWLPATLPLSPAEAALLTVVPFLRATQRAVNSGERRPAMPADQWLNDPARPGAELVARFARAHPRLARASNASSPEAAAAIGWWTFRRWLDRDHARSPRRDEEIGRLAGPLPPGPPDAAGLLDDVLSRKRLAELVRDMDGDLDLLTDADHAGRLATYRKSLVGRGPTQQHVRDRLVGFCLMLTSALALDPGSLGNLVVEHVGGPDPVSLPDLLVTVRQARWTPQSESRLALHASCRHEAVEIALRERVAQVGAILDALHRSADSATDLAGLAAFPSRAISDEVVAGTDEKDKPAYLSPGMRFRLADDQVRELLMGENLYSDKALAIRELYQNALDACRYRQARMQWLNLTQKPPAPLAPPWEGAIRFTQGTDEAGRAYIECSDNGIGMGEHELRQVFSQAGARFVDLPEFLEEQADWEAAGISFSPNSRFGIGVLSYFMLADTVEITTCRLDRRGAPGEQLRVIIPGPGSFFRVRRAGKGSSAGTTIRLRLNAPLEGYSSCVETLRRILFVADFSTEAINGPQRHLWKPGVLSEYASAAVKLFASQRREQKYTPSARPPQTTSLMPSIRAGEEIHVSGTPVWWCSGTGGIIADGLWVGETMHGAIVNLTGRHAPDLAVDRTSVRQYDKAAVRRYLREAAPALRESPPAQNGESVGAYPWLCKLALFDRAAATIALRAITADPSRAWHIETMSANAAATGCLPFDLQDEILFPADHTYLGIYENSSALNAWRRAGWLNASTGWHGGMIAGGVIPATPIDDILAGDAAASRASIANIVRAAADLGISVADACDRFRALGYDMPPVPASTSLEEDDLLLVSLKADGKPPYLPGSAPVSLPQLLFCAARLKKSAREIAERLRVIGYAVPDLSSLPSSLSSEPGWLGNFAPADMSENGKPVRMGFLVANAAAAGIPIGAIAAQLTILGYLVPDISRKLGLATELDARLASRDLSGNSDWLLDGQPVPRSHLVRAARALNMSLSEVATDLGKLGYEVPQAQRKSLPVTESDLQLITHNLPLEWLYGDDGIMGRAIRFAHESGRSLTSVIEQLNDLGYILPRVQLTSSELTATDVRLVSMKVDGENQWLPDSQSISKAFIARAAAILALKAPEAISRLTTFGYHVSAEASELPRELSQEDAELIKQTTGRPNQPSIMFLLFKRVSMADISVVSRGRLIIATAASGLRPRDAVTRLRDLGFTPPYVTSLPEFTVQGDESLVTGDPTVLNPGSILEDDSPVSWPHLARAARRTNTDIRAAAKRLLELGYTLEPSIEKLPQQITDTDLRLATQKLNGTDGWLDSGKEVPPCHLLAAAITLGLTIDDTARRLEQLGYKVCPVREFSSPGAYLRAMEEHEARTRAEEEP